MVTGHLDRKKQAGAFVDRTRAVEVMVPGIVWYLRMARDGVGRCRSRWVIEPDFHGRGSDAGSG